jgi:radical SAM-linked protein
LLLVFERALRRAGLRVSHSQGFNPRPKLTFALALPLGVESLDEIVDVELDELLGAEEVLSRLGKEMPDGLKPHACEALHGKQHLHVAAADFAAQVPEEMREAAKAAVERFHASDAPSVVRDHKGRIRTILLRDFVRDLVYVDDGLAFTLTYADQGSMKPSELLTWLGLDPAALKVVKTRTVLGDGPGIPAPVEDGDLPEPSE